MKPTQRRRRRIDRASLVTILVTVLLFGVAVVEKGFTHEILLEAGVFLISVKLILASAKNDIVMDEIQDQLDKISRQLPPAP